MLFSSHQLADVEQIADHIAIVDRGRVVVDGALDDLRAAYRRIQLVFDGAEVQALSADTLVRRGCIQVMEGRRCFGHLSVEDNLLAGAYTRRDGSAAVRRDLDMVSKQPADLMRFLRPDIIAIFEDIRLAGRELAKAVLGRIDGVAPEELQSIFMPDGRLVFQN